jgi:hypothetical protein
LLARLLDLPEWVVAVAMAFVALFLVGFAFRRMGEEVAPVLYNRDLILIYISAIAILWNLWFFSFWSVSIVSQAAPRGLPSFFGPPGEEADAQPDYGHVEDDADEASYAHKGRWRCPREIDG